MRQSLLYGNLPIIEYFSLWYISQLTYYKALPVVQGAAASLILHRNGMVGHTVALLREVWCIFLF
jgi:hypothetical protein